MGFAKISYTNRPVSRQHPAAGHNTIMAIPVYEAYPVTHENPLAPQRDLSKGYLPVVLVASIMLALAAFIGTASYTIGGVLKGIEDDRRETAARFTQLETSIAKLQQILEARGCAASAR
jgi:hypothetical protein